MAGHYINTVEDQATGRPVNRATILVYEDGASISGDSVTTGTLATIYSDDGVTAIDQTNEPITTESDGEFNFYTEETRVVIAVLYNGTGLAVWNDIDIPGSGFSGDLTALQNRASAIEATLGVDSLDEDLGTFTGSTISDNGSVKDALQELETALELSEVDSIIIACSDEGTAIASTGTKITFRMPYAFTLTAVRASVNSACSTGTLTVDINEGGATILSTKLTIDATEETSTTAAAAAVISDGALADDAEMTIDVDDVGDGTATGLKVVLIGTRA